MLIATITALYLLLSGGGSDADGAPRKLWFDRAHELVGDYVKDEDRADRARSILEEMQDENQAFMERVLELREKLGEVDRDYHAKREDYWTIYREIGAEWTAKEKLLLNLLFDLKKEIPPEEWTPLFAEVYRRSK